MIYNSENLHVGQKVHYQPDHYEPSQFENGMIKEIPTFVDNPKSVGYNCVRVVYNCGGDWNNYKDYTAALTNLRDLNLDWRTCDE